MSAGLERIIGYYLVAPQELDEGTNAIQLTVSEQQERLKTFAQKHDKIIVAEHQEIGDRKRKRFPALDVALDQCKHVSAALVIVHLQAMVRNEHFTDLLIRSGREFVCLDQPLVNQATLPAIVENHRQIRQEHSLRIRRGLEQTMAKLGNPNALKEITRVNKPKTENAIMFALILAPIIAFYRSRGYSQRKMVDSLNEEGFLAPEGGEWVLSQLQKVLERIELNAVAVELSQTLQDFEEKQYTPEQMIRALKAMNAKAPHHAEWTEHLLASLRERLEAIYEIMDFNKFLVEVFPQMLEYQHSGLSDEQIAERLNDEGVQLPERVLWEIKQNILELPADKARHWEADDVDIARNVALRRKEDIDLFVNNATLDKAIDLVDKATT